MVWHLILFQSDQNMKTLKAFIALALFAAPASALTLQQGDSVCIIGNTFGEQLAESGYWEALLHARHGDSEIRVRQLAWPADTLTLRPRPLNALSRDAELTREKASVIIACFGLNESWDTLLPQFEKDLTGFIDHTLSTKYDGTSIPRLVLVSPIAMEQKSKAGTADARARNVVLESFVVSMSKICGAKNVEFVNVFRPLQGEYAARPTRQMTSNGIHLNESGHRFLSSEMDAQLFGKSPPLLKKWTMESMELLRTAVNEKNRQWWFRQRPLNPFYIYGGRTKPFGEASFPLEIEYLEGMVANRDRRIWDIAQGKRTEVEIDDSNLKPLPSYGSTLEPAAEILTPEKQLRAMKMLDGFEVNLFASEIEFPDLANPVQMTFDGKGRMWVATIPSFPHALPGVDPNDKVIILTDKDGDGKADEVKTFADKLYMPIGLELGYGGAYVSAPPNLLHHRDTNGDDKADVTQTVLRGFGAEDSHHAISAFCWGPGGGLHMMEGTFLHSQVETPWGPRRLDNAGVWRFEPSNTRLEVHVSYAYANPWGQTWDRWGRNYLADASGGDNHYGNACSGWLPYPEKHSFMNRFTAQAAHLRPTAGCEVVSSRQWPEEFQGWWLLNNIIGFQGTRMFRLVDDGSGIKATEWKDLLRCTDSNFRPVDIEFGPDGALYIVDWYNPIVGHTTYSMRDPQRLKKHGRIWRVTAKGREVVKPPVIEKAKTAELLALLRTPEDRTRYRIRRELAGRDTPSVLVAIEKFIAPLKESELGSEQLLLECLWVQQWHNAVQAPLLKRVLKSSEPKARAAAVQILRWWHDRIPGSAEMLEKAAQDEYPAVRLEAAVAASFLRSMAGVQIALLAAAKETDYYLDYAIGETLRALEPQWRIGMDKKYPQHFESMPVAGIRVLLKSLSNEELAGLALSKEVAADLLRRDRMTAEQITAAASMLAGSGGSPVEVMLTALPEARGSSLARVLASQEPAELAKFTDALQKLASEATSAEVKTGAFAALAASQSDATAVVARTQDDPTALAALCAAVPLLPEKSRAAVAEQLGAIAGKLPEILSAKFNVGLPAAGRFVRIELLRKGTLSLTEVEVMSGGKNIALNGGNATQSTTAQGGVAGRAIDGGTHGEWGRQTTTMTEEQENPWWELDFGTSQLIAHIAITNRNDYGTDTAKALDGFRITILDSERRPLFTHQHEAAAGRIEIPVKLDASTMQAALIRAWGATPVQAEEKFRTLFPMLASAALREAAVEALKDLDLQKAAAAEIEATAETLKAALPSVPLSERLDPPFATALHFAEKVAAALPAAQGGLRAIIASESPAHLRLKADATQLLFTEKELKAHAGAVVALTLENPGEQPHNAVICIPGSLEKVGGAADAMQTDPNGLSRGFVPAIPEVLHKTRLLNRGERETLVFRVPAAPGDYVIVCTFPGHWRLMHTRLKVEK